MTTPLAPGDTYARRQLALLELMTSVQSGKRALYEDARRQLPTNEEHVRRQTEVALDQLRQYALRLAAENLDAKGQPEAARLARERIDANAALFTGNPAYANSIAVVGRSRPGAVVEPSRRQMRLMDRYVTTLTDLYAARARPADTRPEIELRTAQIEAATDKARLVRLQILQLTDERAYEATRDGGPPLNLKGKQRKYLENQQAQTQNDLKNDVFRELGQSNYSSDVAKETGRQQRNPLWRAWYAVVRTTAQAQASAERNREREKERVAALEGRATAETDTGAQQQPAQSPQARAAAPVVAPTPIGDPSMVNVVDLANEAAHAQLAANAMRGAMTRPGAAMDPVTTQLMTHEAVQLAEHASAARGLSLLLAARPQILRMSAAQHTPQDQRDLAQGVDLQIANLRGRLGAVRTASAPLLQQGNLALGRPQPGAPLMHGNAADLNRDADNLAAAWVNQTAVAPEAWEPSLRFGPAQVGYNSLANIHRDQLEQATAFQAGQMAAAQATAAHAANLGVTTPGPVAQGPSPVAPNVAPATPAPGAIPPIPNYAPYVAPPAPSAAPSPTPPAPSYDPYMTPQAPSAAPSPTPPAPSYDPYVAPQAPSAGQSAAANPASRWSAADIDSGRFVSNYDDWLDEPDFPTAAEPTPPQPQRPYDPYYDPYVTPPTPNRAPSATPAAAPASDPYTPPPAPAAPPAPEPSSGEAAVNNAELEAMGRHIGFMGTALHQFGATPQQQRDGVTLQEAAIYMVEGALLNDAGAHANARVPAAMQDLGGAVSAAEVAARQNSVGQAVTHLQGEVQQQLTTGPYADVLRTYSPLFQEASSTAPLGPPADRPATVEALGEAIALGAGPAASGNMSTETWTVVRDHLARTTGSDSPAMQPYANAVQAMNAPPAPAPEAGPAPAPAVNPAVTASMAGTTHAADMTTSARQETGVARGGGTSQGPARGRETARGGQNTSQSTDLGRTPGGPGSGPTPGA